MRQAHDAGTATYVGAVVLGVVLLALFVLAWRGTWRSWVGDSHGAAPLFAIPGVGVMAVAYGAGPVLPDRLGLALLGLSLLAALVAFAIGTWDPPWFGPAWYRLFKHRRSSLGYRGGHPETPRRPRRHGGGSR